MRTLTWLAAVGLVAGLGCATKPAPAVRVASSSQPAESESDEDAVEVNKLSHQVQVAEAELKAAQLALVLQQKQAQADIAKARGQVELAARKLEVRRDKTGPTELADARVELKRSEDNVKEAQEEMAQLELMYQEDDLADKTKEIVISRGKRHLERAREALVVKAQQLVDLEKHTIPLDLAELAKQLEEKQAELAAAERDAEEGKLTKQIAVMKAEADLYERQADLNDQLHGNGKKSKKDGEK